jgi:hypothetical protein
MEKGQNPLKTLPKPIGWLNWSKDPSLLVLKIYGFGEESTSCLYFKIPLVSLDRFFNGSIEGCPVFEVLEGEIPE